MNLISGGSDYISNNGMINKVILFKKKVSGRNRERAVLLILMFLRVV